MNYKQTKLCKTNPISKNEKSNVICYLTNEYGNNSSITAMQKRTQNEPKRTQFIVSLPALSEAEGSNLFQTASFIMD